MRNYFFQRISRLCALGIYTVLFPTFASAAVYYIDPLTGQDSNDGSSTSPWPSLQYLLDNDMIESQEWDSLPYTESSTLVAKNQGAVVQPGDTLVLRNGNYGELGIVGYYNVAPITITVESGSTAVFRNIQIRSASNWIISGITVNAAAYADDTFETLIDLDSHGWSGPIHNVKVADCTLYSIEDSSGWSQDDWINKAKSGLSVDGSNMTISENRLVNVRHGISVGASYSLVEKNSVTNFSGDGLRGLGDYTVFQYNTITNCYDVDDNHDDGFQSWSVGSDGSVGTGVVKGIVLRGNTIINYEDENQPFRGTLQGIGCFDVMYQDWLVEGNTIKTDNWHGISMYGAVDSVLRDNVVQDLNTETPGPPWIKLGDHKDGRASTGNTVTCNIAPRFEVNEADGNILLYNTISEVGSGRHSACPALADMTPILPLLLLEEN